MNGQKVYAHQGAAGYFVGNTLAAFSRAIELGCDGAELDVQLSKDGVVIVHHNPRLNYKYCRKGNGEYITEAEGILLENLMLDEIKEYTIGEPNPLTFNYEVWPNLAFKSGEYIPTLVEVIKLIKEKSSKFKLIIEIKSDIFREEKDTWKPLVHKVLEILEELDFETRSIICSINWNILIYTKNKNKKISVWFTTFPFSWFIEKDVYKKDIQPSLGYRARLIKSWKEKKWIGLPVFNRKH